MGKKTHYTFFSFGNFANTLAYNVFTNRIQFFYIDILRLNPATAGLIWALFGIWNAINDPLMGSLSDRTRSRWGRRIPYILFGAIPLGLSFVLLWTPPTGNLTVLAVYFLAALFIFDTIFSLLHMAFNALFPEVASTLEDRSLLSAFREGNGVVALLLAFILAPILSEELGFWQMGAIIGTLTAVTYMISTIGTKEDLQRLGEKTLGFLPSLVEALKNITFRWYLVVSVCKELVFVILSATLPFWAKYVLNLQDGPILGVNLGAGDQESILLGLPLLLTLVWLAVWQRLIPRLGTRSAWSAAFLAFIPGLAVMFLANSFATGLLGTLLISPALAGIMAMPYVMLSQIVDTDAQMVGMRREGMYMGINGGIGKLSFVIQGLLFAVILSTTGYQADAAGQTASALFGIRALIALSPMLAVVVAVIALRQMRSLEGAQLPSLDSSGAA